MKNHHSPPGLCHFRRLPLLTGIAVIITTACARSAVTINSTVDFLAGVYTYTYSISNFGTTLDLTVVNIPVGMAVPANNLMTPVGFNAIYDGGAINQVSFFEDTDPSTTAKFAPDSTTGFFSFTSNFGPGLVTFDAQDADGNTFTGVTQSAVPEPSSLLLLAAAAIPLMASRRRRPSA